MSPINKEIIDALERYRQMSLEDFLNDHTIQAASELYMLRGIEVIVDVGNHLLSEVFQCSAKEYKEVLLLLGEKSIMPQDFAEQNSDMVGFRNRLAHVYMDMDYTKVYDYLVKAPDIFRKFTKYFIEFVEQCQ